MRTIVKTPYSASSATVKFHATLRSKQTPLGTDALNRDSTAGARSADAKPAANSDSSERESLALSESGAGAPQMELVAYRLYSKEICDLFDLSPSKRHRDWMDATPDKFAYRCLPLAIANQLGWSLSCPISFDAIWDGSSALNGVVFEFDKSDAGIQLDWSAYISCHFGSGIITFSLPFIFRTSPGCGLYIRGAPNHIKPGASALDAFVETDWHDLTFTMNWKITEPNRRIRFTKGEPICSILPLSIGGYEQISPATMAIQEYASLHQALASKSASRKDFIARPDRGSDWQKFYFRGENADGERQQNHLVKLALQAFTPR